MLHTARNYRAIVFQMKAAQTVEDVLALLPASCVARDRVEELPSQLKGRKIYRIDYRSPEPLAGEDPEIDGEEFLGRTVFRYFLYACFSLIPGQRYTILAVPHSSLARIIFPLIDAGRESGVRRDRPTYHCIDLPVVMEEVRNAADGLPYLHVLTCTFRLTGDTELDVVSLKGQDVFNGHAFESIWRGLKAFELQLERAKMAFRPISRAATVLETDCHGNISVAVSRDGANLGSLCDLILKLKQVNALKESPVFPARAAVLAREGRKRAT